MEQFVPVLVYRTGPFSPNGTPWANGFVDYLKLVNARGQLERGEKLLGNAWINQADYDQLVLNVATAESRCRVAEWCWRACWGRGRTYSIC